MTVTTAEIVARPLPSPASWSRAGEERPAGSPTPPARAGRSGCVPGPGLRPFHPVPGAQLFNQDECRCDRCGARSDLTQRCAVCSEALCPRCYDGWTALACGPCRRRRALAVVR